MRTKLLVPSAERPPQRRLLIEQHKQERNPPGNPPPDCPRSQHQKNRRPHDGQPAPPTTDDYFRVHANLQHTEAYTPSKPHSNPNPTPQTRYPRDVATSATTDPTRAPAATVAQATPTLLPDYATLFKLPLSTMAVITAEGRQLQGAAA